jgi:hypothetical protein
VFQRTHGLLAEQMHGKVSGQISIASSSIRMMLFVPVEIG